MVNCHAGYMIRRVTRITITRKGCKPEIIVSGQYSVISQQINMSTNQHVNKSTTHRLCEVYKGWRPELNSFLLVLLRNLGLIVLIYRAMGHIVLFVSIQKTDIFSNICYAITNIIRTFIPRKRLPPWVFYQYNKQIISILPDGGLVKL